MNMEIKLRQGQGSIWRRAKRLARAALSGHIPVVPTTRPVFALLYRTHVLVREGGLWALRFFWFEPLFRSQCTTVGSGLRMEQLPYLHGTGRITLGRNVRLSGKSSIGFCNHVSERPELVIGDGSFVGHACSFGIAGSVRIGANCLIAGGVTIRDCDGHPVDAQRRISRDRTTADEIRPVIIEDGAWIGSGARILKGVRIGARSIVGAGAVVSRDVPPDCIFAGNPARIVKSLLQEDRNGSSLVGTPPPEDAASHPIKLVKEQSQTSDTIEPCPSCGSDSVRGLHQREFQNRRWTLARCKTCGQHFTSPTPSEADLRAFYAGDYHGELRQNGGSEAAFGSKYRRYADTLARHLQSGRVLDVGCSTGLLVRLLCDRGYQAEGVELNQQSAVWGSAHYGVRIHNQTLANCGFPEESLDAVLLTDVLEHTRHPTDFLRSVAPLLAPNGLVIVTFPDIRSLESLYQRALAKLTGRNWLWRSCHIPLHVWEFTPKTAEQCFAGAGFRVLEFRRSQPPFERATSGLVRLAELPLRLLSLAAFGSWQGTQMEFVIQRVPETSENNRVSQPKTEVRVVAERPKRIAL